jgi:two-component system, cell cycle sensor histidine kinase and response regulator CckA
LTPFFTTKFMGRALGLAALHLFGRHGDEIALVLLDMTMPILSGDEAVHHLMRIRPDAVVVASSGYGELEARRRFEGTGGRAFLQKPYSSEQLSALVSRLTRIDGSCSRA